jgi:hypothetical protein
VIGTSEEIVCRKRSVMIWASNDVVTKGIFFFSVSLPQKAGRRRVYTERTYLEFPKVCY